jgi:nucleotide-binding universal stress UspA family protein
VETAHTPFTDILVPLDGSMDAERALTPALDLATRTGVPLRLLRRASTDDKDVAAAYLAGVADRHAGRTAIETLVDDREPIPDTILDWLDLGTLVCMSSHGRGGVARAVMGSVAEGVLRRLDRPALVVGPHLSADASFTGRIVACVDGSPESELTLEPARRWGRLLDRPLWLVEVAPPGPPPEWSTHGDVIESGHVARLAGGMDDVGGWDVLHDKHPAHALAGLGAPGEDPTALLVMATHGRTGWDRLRLGSVTATTVHAASVPVLVVPAAPTPVTGAGNDVVARGTAAW